MNSAMSFWDYKINYNRLLGTGVWNTVYELVPRPKDEQNYWSYLFPYIYDLIFRPSMPQQATYCVKILSPGPTALLALLAFKKDKLLLITTVATILLWRCQDTWNNQTAKKYNLSNVTFHSTYSFLSYFATKVDGHTFYYHANKRHFTKVSQFNLRRAFVEFMQKLNNRNLELSDLHEKNIMYDKNTNCWEIVDGNVADGGVSKVIQKTVKAITSIFSFQQKETDNISQFLNNLQDYPQEIAPILSTLAYHARNNICYDQHIDIQTISQKNPGPP